MIVDNFFEEPDTIRDYALSLPYKESERNTWPGKRTDFLHDVSPELFRGVMQKTVGLLFSEKTPINYNTLMAFQLTGEIYEKGWVHHDSSVSTITAIIYLTPGSSSGTSLYLKNNVIECNDSKYIEEKKDSFKTKKINSDIRTKHNNQYYETISVKGIYNRLFLFESHMYHAAHEFFGDTSNTSRLTLVYFIDFTALTSQLPVIRSNRMSTGI